MFKPNIQKLWATHRSEFIRLLYDEQPKPITHSGLEQRYMDKQGRFYYGWPTDGAIPIERYGKVLDYMQYMTKGLTAHEDDKMDDAISSALEDGLRDQKKKSAARIGVIIEERKKRRSMCIHTELIYNYLAVQWARQDEDPNVFDNEIQMQKVETIKEENKNGAVGFFFQQKELKKLRDLLEMSKEDWQLSMNEYQIQEKRLSELLMMVGSDRTLKEAEKTLRSA